MNGTNGNEPGYPENALVPYPVIVVATKGDPDAMKERPFFASLTEYMSSGPVVCAILEGDKAISRYRELMGATNPANAAEGTIRKKYAESIEANSVHGSDAPETAAYEMAYFFNALEITG